MTEERRPIPVFKTEAEERAFWESHDSSDHIDWSKAKRTRFPSRADRKYRRIFLATC